MNTQMQPLGGSCRICFWNTSRIWHSIRYFIKILLWISLLILQDFFRTSSREDLENSFRRINNLMNLKLRRFHRSTSEQNLRKQKFSISVIFRHIIKKCIIAEVLTRRKIISSYNQLLVYFKQNFSLKYAQTKFCFKSTKCTVWNKLRFHVVRSTTF